MLKHVVNRMKTKEPESKDRENYGSLRPFEVTKENEGILSRYNKDKLFQAGEKTETPIDLSKDVQNQTTLQLKTNNRKNY